MPRFERPDDRRFWEITLDGKTVQTRAGFLGSEGRPSNKTTFPSLKAAQAEVAERVAEQKAKGYVQRPGARSRSTRRSPPRSPTRRTTRARTSSTPTGCRARSSRAESW